LRVNEADNDSGPAKARAAPSLRGSMKRWLCSSIATIFLLAASSASATFHLYHFKQAYSNADGSVQFIVATAFSSGAMSPSSAACSAT